MLGVMFRRVRVQFIQVVFCNQSRFWGFFVLIWQLFSFFFFGCGRISLERILFCLISLRMVWYLSGIRVFMCVEFQSRFRFLFGSRFFLLVVLCVEYRLFAVRGGWRWFSWFLLYMVLKIFLFLGQLQFGFVVKVYFIISLWLFQFLCKQQRCRKFRWFFWDRRLRKVGFV